jgi:hypothetical protein
LSDTTEPAVAPVETPPPATPATTAAPADDGKGPVPYSRFDEVRRERDDWRTRAESASKVEADLVAARESFAKLQAELDAERSARADDRAFAAVGLLDSDAQDVARLLYGKVSEKPEGGLAAWLAAATEKPDAAPMPLRPYLSQPAKPPKPAPMDTSDPTGAARVVTGDVTAEQLRAAREVGRTTGDWSQFDRLKSATVGRRR